MKKLLVIAMLTMFAAAPAIAADTYTYTGKGTVTFNHKAHGEKLGCEKCHEGEPKKIEIKDKDTGHATCLDCHKAMKDQGAPTKCNDCHKS
ncbi:c-type cytochrome [Desulfuromonas versatilis]|uniref:C-type cytochrome n=1 Tax=Desulfuromonas versatilis TaxID=2802975 RepID=A0ABM8HPZ2_9BACT|nr:cytochrome c3 family protein [Desulfuromonas versatilis]BCR03831.1 c-type cytochrome [Desulfuromonas versatilis]